MSSKNFKNTFSEPFKSFFFSLKYSIYIYYQRNYARNKNTNQIRTKSKTHQNTGVIHTFFLCLCFRFLAQSCSQTNLLTWPCSVCIFSKLHLCHHIFSLQLEVWGKAKCDFHLRTMLFKIVYKTTNVVHYTDSRTVLQYSDVKRQLLKEFIVTG